MFFNCLLNWSYPNSRNPDTSISNNDKGITRFTYLWYTHLYICLCLQETYRNRKPFETGHGHEKKKRKSFKCMRKEYKRTEALWKIFSDYVHQTRLRCDFMMLNAVVSDHFLNAHGHFIITCPPSVFKRASDINQNFLKKKLRICNFFISFKVHVVVNFSSQGNFYFSFVLTLEKQKLPEIKN